jgi:hypothetical protein
MAIVDSATVKDEVAGAKLRIDMSEATMTFRNGGGEAKIVLGPSDTARWVAQYWEIVRPAMGVR